MLPAGQSAKGQLVARFAVAQNLGKPDGNHADEHKHTDGQGNNFDIVALDKGELLGGTLEKDGGCAQYQADDGGKPKFGACHERLKPLAVLVDGIAGSVMELLPNELNLLFGNVSFDEYLLGKGRDATAAEIKRLGYNKAVGLNNALKVLEAFIESWIKYSTADRKLRMCIVTAQARWRSKVEIELLGL